MHKDPNLASYNNLLNAIAKRGWIEVHGGTLPSNPNFIYQQQNMNDKENQINLQF